MVVTLLPKESYLAMIQNSVGADVFRNCIALVDGEKKDVTEDGIKSCALFVSTILHTFNHIESPHATVSGLEKDLQRSGWNKTDAPQIGDVIIWEPKLQGGDVNAHTGFYIGNDEAISNNWEARTPQKHHYTYGLNADGTPVRAITAIYTKDLTK